jgi:glycine/D-amino acid oxidase-like deaminating enzyme
MPRATILLLEAERVGYGASGRNAGFLSPLAAPIWLLGESPDSAWAARHLHGLLAELVRWLPAGIELAPAKLALVARGRLQRAALDAFIAGVTRVGLPHELVDGALAMDAYTLHPYKLVRALAEQATREGVRIRERSRVLAIEPTAGGARVVLAERAIEANRVVVCTNAYTGSLLGERIAAVPVHAYLALAAPSRIASDFVVEVGGAYHRTHAGALLYGAVDTLVAPLDFEVPEPVRARMQRAMRASFGTEPPITEAWSGAFHVTPTGLPIIRSAHKPSAVILNVGYGGTGVALALSLAAIAAQLTAGGLVACSDEARLLAAIHATRLSPGLAVRTGAQIVRHLVNVP